MGLGGAGAYSGPVFGDGPAATVPGAGGYGDTGRGSVTGLGFSPAGIEGAGVARPHAHAMTFGVLCFAGLLILAWVLPR